MATSSTAERTERDTRAVRTRHRPSQWLFEERGFTLSRLLVDVVALAGALLLARDLTPTEEDNPVVFLYPLLVVVFLALRRMYDPTAQISALDRMANVVGCVGLASVLTCGIVGLIEPADLRPDIALYQLIFGVGFIAVGRGFLHVLRMRARILRTAGKRTLIVGAGEVGTLLDRRLHEMPQLGLIPVGFLDPDPVTPPDGPARVDPVLGSLAELPEVVTETGAEHVILAFTVAPDSGLRPVVRLCEELGLEVSIVPRLFDETTNRIVLEHIGGLPVFALREVDPKGWQFAIKHTFDRVCALILLVLFSPILLGAALAVRLSSPGPVLFRQRRLGRDGRVFDLYKFRSMRVAPKGAGGASVPGEVDAHHGPGGVEGDDRRTAVGVFFRKSSIDELPQLLNVLRGEMSIVGPRPERPELVELFEEIVDRYADRHRVKSGITGWAQVHSLRGKTSMVDRVEWDNFYIQNWSLWLDVKILLMTPGALLRGAE